MARVCSIPEKISETVIGEIKNTKTTKGKYKKNQRALLKFGLFIQEYYYPCQYRSQPNNLEMLANYKSSLFISPEIDRLYGL